MLQSKNYCSGCTSEKVYLISMPYACKLMLQELLAMNIKPKLKLKPVLER